jgi:hypothetical protein
MTRKGVMTLSSSILLYAERRVWNVPNYRSKSKYSYHNSRECDTVSVRNFSCVFGFFLNRALFMMARAS